MLVACEPLPHGPSRHSRQRPGAGARKGRPQSGHSWSGSGRGSDGREAGSGGGSSAVSRCASSAAGRRSSVTGGRCAVRERRTASGRTPRSSHAATAGERRAVSRSDNSRRSSSRRRAARSATAVASRARSAPSGAGSGGLGAGGVGPGVEAGGVESSGADGGAGAGSCGRSCAGVLASGGAASACRACGSPGVSVGCAYDTVRVTTRPLGVRLTVRARYPYASNSRSAAAIRASPSGKRAVSDLMSTLVPSGTDWMWTASPIARSDSSRCWARWLPTTVKRSR